MHRTKQSVPGQCVKSTLMKIQEFYSYLILTQCWFVTPPPKHLSSILGLMASTSFQIFNTISTQIMALRACTPYIIVSFIPAFRRNLLSPSSMWLIFVRVGGEVIDRRKCQLQRETCQGFWPVRAAEEKDLGVTRCMTNPSAFPRKTENLIHDE
jgi:hypothetical protein